MKTGTTWMQAVGCALALGLVAGAASAADLRVKCESRGNPARAKVSVDARDLLPANAVYTAQVTSGATTVAHAPLAAVAGEAEFDFDSNPADVAAGARAIPSNFIVGGSVTASVFDTAGNVIVGPRNASCRSR